MDAGQWPLILAGPIVRRVEARLASVWVALRSPCTIRLDIWDGLERGDTTRAPSFSVTTHSLRAADNLHIGLPVLEVPPSQAPLLPGRVYSYNLTLTEDGTSLARDLRTLTLLEDVAGTVQSDRLVIKPHLALGYAGGMLPSFALPPPSLTDLKLLHGSCRRPHAETPDAMVFVDELIQETRADALARPHQLFLTGDQIYADDVATAFLDMLIPVANELTGNFVVGDELTGGVEHLPTRWPLSGAQAGVRLWPADRRHFPPGLRTNVVVNDARMSTVDHESHLLSFGEFCAMYLLCWSNALWPDRIPRMEAVFDVPVEIGAPDMEIWKLHSGIESGLPAGTDQGLLQRFGSAEQRARITQFTATNLNEVMQAHCKAVRGSFDRHRRVLAAFRDGLPKIRRALANVPTYMVFDDHEVTDDWYLSPIWRDRVLTAPLGRTVVRNGLLAYALFQGWGNDPKRFQERVRAASGQLEPGPHLQLLDRIQELFPHGDEVPPAAAPADAADHLLGLDFEDPPPVTWHYAVPGPRHLVQVLDCRTRRTYASRVSGPGNVSPQALAEQLPGGPLPSGVDVLVVVSSLTVLGTAVIDELIGPMLYRLFDLGHGNTAEMPGLNPDAIEAWPYDPKVFESLLKRLETYRRVVILSGDVHFGTSAAMSYWKRSDALPARFAQFISSGLQNLIRDEVRMASQYMAFMQRVIQAKVGVERLGWNATAPDLVVVPPGQRAKPALRDRLRTAPVLLPSEGWPAGTTENPARPPDWSWRMDVVGDPRPDGQRAPAVRPPELVPGSPTVDVAPNRDGYRAVMVRHVKHLEKQPDNLAHTRQILFSSNLGRVHFERPADGLLRGVHQLYAVAARAPAGTKPQVATRHEIVLDVTPASPPEQRTRPTLRGTR